MPQIAVSGKAGVPDVGPNREQMPEKAPHLFVRLRHAVVKGGNLNIVSLFA